MAFAVFCMANAQPVSMQQALQRAQRFMPEKTFSVHNKRRAYGVVDNTEVAPYYIFNAEDNGGFVIVSGEEKTEEILGYSDTDCLDMENMPNNVRLWLEDYAKAIEQAQQREGAIRKVEMSDDKKTVAPLLKTQWNQYAPYNERCPLIGGERCVTGCVATAVAQIMRYYKYPASSKATFQYRTRTNKLTMKALPATDFAWNKMLKTYNGNYTQEEANAVATLMLYCGCALSMDYAVDGSGADATPVCDAMEYFFGYDDGIKKVYRNNYNAKTWEELIYNELAKGYPVFYSGSTNENSGHAFVCDGYDKGFFHINWGWGGYCDGHFKLSVLYPYADSYDDTEHEGGYASGQMAVINIVPKDFQGFEKEIEIFPMEENAEIDFGKSSIEENDLTNSVIDNVYVTLNIDGNDGYNTKEKCIEIASTVTDEQLAAIANKEVTDENVRKKYNGLILEIPKGENTISINVQTRGSRVLKVKIGDTEALTFVQTERSVVKIPYIANKNTYVYIYGAETEKEIVAGNMENSVLIYSIKRCASLPSYTLIYKVDNEIYKSIEKVYGASITPEAMPIKEGYTFSGWSVIPAIMPAKEVVVTGSFTINKYKLTYMVDDKTYKTFEVEYGASIAAESEPVKDGYNFSGWSEIPATMPARDVTVTGTFTINKYNLTYMIDGVTCKTSEVEYGTVIKPELEPIKEGYTFSGWSEIPATMLAKEVVVTGGFTINKYTLTYNVDGETYKTYEVEYGTNITPEAEPTKEGYSFSGWSLIPTTMPAKDVIVTGSFTKGQYKLVYKVDGQTYKTVSFDYGAAITPEDAPERDGYTFSGWSEIPAAMPAKDVTVTGSFTINKYTLTYQVDGEIYKTYEVEYGADITAEEEPKKEGYTFSGWSWIPDTMPAEDVVITGSFTFIDAIDDVIAYDGTYQIFTLDGIPVESLQKGVNIIRYSNGTTKSVYVK